MEKICLPGGIVMRLSVKGESTVYHFLFFAEGLLWSTEIAAY
jgi:hypothetical protein